VFVSRRSVYREIAKMKAATHTDSIASMIASAMRRGWLDPADSEAVYLR
jgi:hypothetical protein